MKDMFKGWLAGFVIGLAALVYLCYFGFTLGYTALGAFLFSFGLYAVLDEGMNLVTGKFGTFYDGSWSFRQILLIFVANLIGVGTAFLIRRLDAHPELIYEAAKPIIAARDAKFWYQHILAGIGCGACIQIAVYNYKKTPSFWGVCLPVMVFILCGFEHCIADSFYYCWGVFAWQHILQVFLVFIGNFIGSTLVVAASQGIHPHWSL